MRPTNTTASFSQGYMPMHARGFDGGETTLGRLLRSLPWLRPAAYPAAQARVQARKATNSNRFGPDGGQSRSWDFCGGPEGKIIKGRPCTPSIWKLSKNLGRHWPSGLCRLPSHKI